MRSDGKFLSSCNVNPLLVFQDLLVLSGIQPTKSKGRFISETRTIEHWNSRRKTSKCQSAAYVLGERDISKSSIGQQRFFPFNKNKIKHGDRTGKQEKLMIVILEMECDKLEVFRKVGEISQLNR